MNFFKQLSNRYLKDAKKIGYTWIDLVKKITRQTVITKVQQYQNNTKVINKAIKDTIKTGINDTKIQQIENEIKNEYNRLIRESNIRQMEDEIKKEHKRLIQQQKTKQTADVLIFKRYDNKGEIPEGKKIAFRDNDGKPYVIKFVDISLSIVLMQWIPINTKENEYMITTIIILKDMILIE